MKRSTNRGMHFIQRSSKILKYEVFKVKSHSIKSVVKILNLTAHFRHLVMFRIKIVLEKRMVIDGSYVFFKMHPINTNKKFYLFLFNSKPKYLHKSIWHSIDSTTNNCYLFSTNAISTLQNKFDHFLLNKANLMS